MLQQFAAMSMMIGALFAPIPRGGLASTPSVTVGRTKKTRDGPQFAETKHNIFVNDATHAVSRLLHQQ